MAKERPIWKGMPRRWLADFLRVCWQDNGGLPLPQQQPRPSATARILLTKTRARTSNCTMGGVDLCKPKSPRRCFATHWAVQPPALPEQGSPGLGSLVGRFSHGAAKRAPASRRQMTDGAWLDLLATGCWNALAKDVWGARWPCGCPCGHGGTRLPNLDGHRRSLTALTR